MTVQEKIKSILEGMGENYMYDNWTNANVRLDKGTFPCVIDLLPVSGSFEFGKAQIKDKPNMMLAFVDKADFDFSGEDNGKVVEECKKRAKAFLLALNKSGAFYPIEGDIPYSVFYDKFDVNVTGIAIEFQPRETIGTVLCLGKTIKELVYGSGKE